MNAAATPISPAELPAEAPPLRESFSGIHLRALLVALGIVLLAVAKFLGWLRPDHDDVYSLWAMAGLALAATPVFIDSLSSLRSEGFEATKYYMDQFVALAILACFATAQYATGTIVAAILIIGQILEERTTLGVEEAIDALTRMARVKARLLGGEGETLVDAASLTEGARIRLLPGDTVPADAEIVSGHTTLDQAAITGESLPVEAAAGARIFAGTTNLTGSLEARVLSAGSETVLGRVTQIVEEAKTSRAPVMRLIDEYTRYYMPLVLIIAAFVLFFTQDVQRAIAVIIVAMPCAFVLASPSAMVAALAVASRMGVLVKSSQFFEVAQHIDTVVFDKTGTLTTGQLQVTDVRPADGREPAALLAEAAALEAQSTHPVARAVRAAAEQQGVEYVRDLPATEAAGFGMRAGGLLAGRRQFLEQHGVAVPVGEGSKDSILHLARDGAYAGAIHLADRVRPEAAQTVEQLRALGLEHFHMLTGDTAAVAESIAQTTGIAQVRSQCLPEEKLAEVQRLKSEGRRVLVIGDGVNDAPALAAGDLGVAMGALGSDVAIKTADVALMGHDLRMLPAFLRLSERALRIINQNLIWGCIFIVLFIALSAFGLISPIVAAVLHEFSAFFVIFNSARLLRFDEVE